ncbi:hypothetical protein BJY52DRAFT_1287482 [Lactarius psammicola]|nr:hypothetical protein BJY52DRAFT_1287482 [Lactarius psammicola]
MAIGFGRNMADSPMVVVWPSRGPDGAFDSVTLSQRKAPYETMPTPDPDPPFVAKLSLSLSDTSVTSTHPQIAFTRWVSNSLASFGGCFFVGTDGRTPPGSADSDAHISIHHRIGRGTLNLTRIAPTPSSGSNIDEKAKGMREGETHVGGFANLMHGALCMTGFLLVIPSGVLVVQYAKATGSSKALQIHRLLQLRLAGGFIVGGTLAYLFMDNDTSGGAAAHKAGSTDLLLLYVVQCAYGSWVYRIPGRSRTRVHRALLVGLGATIVLLAFYQTWLGLVAVGRDTLLWLVLLISVFSLYVFGVVMVRRQFGSVQVAERGEGVALDTRAPNEEPADGGEKL